MDFNKRKAFKPQMEIIILTSFSLFWVGGSSSIGLKFHLYFRMLLDFLILLIIYFDLTSESAICVAEQPVSIFLCVQYLLLCWQCKGYFL